MAPLNASVQVDDLRVQRGLKLLKRAGQDLRPAFRALKKPLIDSLISIAEEERGPTGPWPGLSDSSRRRRRLSPFPLMLGAMAHQTGNTKVSQLKNTLQAKNKVGFSGLHQDGYTTPTGGKVPAREFVWFEDPFLERANEVVLEHLEKAWQS